MKDLKLQWEEFRMGSFFKFGQAVLEIWIELNFSAPKKQGFLRQEEISYISEMAPERKFLKPFIQFSKIKHS